MTPWLAMLLLAAQVPRYDDALARYRAGEFEAARQLLEPPGNDPAALRLLAWCHYRLGHSADALAAAARAVAIDPRDAAAWKFKGMLEAANGDFKRAVDSLGHAASLNAADPEIYEKLGAAQAVLFDYAAARATFERAIARFPRYAPLYAAYANALAASGNAGAREAYQKAIALDPANLTAHYELGRLLVEEGEPAAAVAHLEVAVRIAPNYAPAWLTLANAYRALQRPEDHARAVAHYRALAAR